MKTGATGEHSSALLSGDDPRAAALVTLLRLHWFIRLRWVFLVAAGAALALERLLVGGTPRPLGALAAVLAVLGAANIGWSAWSHVLFRRLGADQTAAAGPPRPVALLANAQVAVDLLLLTCILRFSGGAESPMAMFYLFHMAIVALLLRRWQALLQGLWALLLYAGLVLGEWGGWVAPHYGFLPGRALAPRGDTRYVVATLLVVACGIFGTLYFTLQIVRRLELRERMLREAIAALQRSQLAIQDLQRRRSRFMQTAAHQLKSPLAVIQTLTELIRSRVVPPEEIPRTCEKVIRRCREGIAQVSELLTLARVQEADPVRHGRAEADVAALVADLCQRYKPVADEKQIELSWHLPQEGVPRARVEQRDLGDCLSNLIENALKYTPGPGRVTVNVEVLGRGTDGESVAISVSDTGIGIAPDLLRSPDGAPGHEPIFDPFRRGNNALEAGIPGTGLGLSIVREVVEQAGGRIRVASRLCEGATFTVVFPTTRAAAPSVRVRDTRASEVVVGSRPVAGAPAAGEDGRA